MMKNVKNLIGMVIAMMVYMAAAAMPTYAEMLIITDSAKEAMERAGGTGVAAEELPVVEEETPEEEETVTAPVHGTAGPVAAAPTETAATQAETAKDEEPVAQTPEEAEFTADGKVDASFVALANEYLEMLPQEVRVRLRQDEWNLYVTDKDLTHIYREKLPDLLKGVSSSSIAGVTTWTSAGKFIYVEDRINAIRHAALHETGHAVDSELGIVSDGQEFTAVFQAEKVNFTDTTSVQDSHETSNVREYFASAWSEYFINPANLMARVPQTYAFVERALCAYAGCVDVSELTYRQEGAGGFDADTYFRNYPDLQAAIGHHPDALYQHYLVYGIAEGRNASTRING